jgi:hypothetical protein
MSLFDPLLEAIRASAPTDLRTAQARAVVADYGVFLEGAAPAGTVADESELPYTKEILKWALQTVFGLTADPAHHEALKIGYLRLADWQPAATSTFFALSHRGGGDPLSLARRLAAAKAPEQERQSVSQAERIGLVEELRRLGYW